MQEKVENDKKNFHFINNVITQIIPIVMVIKSNHIIENKMDRLKSTDIPRNTTRYRYLYEDYEFSINSKNSLEDKAKMIVAAITIAISLILNLSNLIQDVYSRYCDIRIRRAIFAGTIIAIIYMIIAGLSAIGVLVGKNYLYKVNPEDKQHKDKKQLLYAIKMNNYQNMIRNNFIYSSYISIRNSLLILLVLFALSVWP